MGKYVIRPEERPTYVPAGHTGTVNRALIGKENVGARFMEVVMGIMEPGGVAEAHKHDKEEQAIYVIEGQATIDVEGVIEEAKAGDMVFFPVGKMHKIVPHGGMYRCLVIYAPHRSPAH